MPNHQARKRERAMAQTFHWVIAALIVTQFVLGWTANNLPLGVHKFALFARHKSFGMTVLVLAGPRLAWRLYHKPPPLPVGMSWIETRLAAATYAAFYVLLFSMPFTGWLM